MKKLTPDICTGTCATMPQYHCRECSHAIFFGKAVVNGIKYRWEHCPRFGPLFSRKKDGECDWTPHQRHPVWKAFQKWHDRKFGRAKGDQP